MPEGLTNPEVQRSLELATVETQVKNIAKWNQAYGLGLEVPTIDAGLASAESDLEHSIVLTPNLGDTEQTFFALWQIIKDQYAGPTGEAFKNDPNYEKQVLIAIDERLPARVHQRAKSSILNPAGKFTYDGEKVIHRPKNGVSISEIDTTAYYAPLPEGVTQMSSEYTPAAPFRIRTPENAPGVEVLAFLAHNPDYVKSMSAANKDHNPWLWVPGVQFHDVNGNFTARTPMVAVLPDNTLKLAAVWNDAGSLVASIPQFIRTPEAV